MTEVILFLSKDFLFLLVRDGIVQRLGVDVIVLPSLHPSFPNWVPMIPEDCFEESFPEPSSRYEWRNAPGVGSVIEINARTPQPRPRIKRVWKRTRPRERERRNVYARIRR